MGTLFGFIVVAEVEGFPMALNWGDCDFGRVELSDGMSRGEKGCFRYIYSRGRS